MNKTRLTILILIALPTLGALAGRLAAPALARFDYVVRVAEHVRADELRPKPAETAEAPLKAKDVDKEVKAFKSTGLPVATIYAQAAEVRAHFAIGSVWLGLFCGLVAAAKILTALVWRGQREYDADPAHCLACARCYLSCPVERERLQHVSAERPL